jgi:hypothetical protein
MSADSLLLVVDDPPLLLVPQDGDRDAALEVRVGRVVGLLQEVEAVDRIGERPAGERPSALVAIGVGVRDADLQPGDRSDDRRPLGPRACQGDVQMMTVRTALGAVAELALLADEGSGGHWVEGLPVRACR